MAQVSTIRGPLDTGRLGFTLMHEHIVTQSPDWRYTHIPQDVLPALREAGVTDSQIDQMTRDNPRRIFERTGGY